MSNPEYYVIANGQRLTADLPCNLHDLLCAHQIVPQTVVVELNGEAVAPSEFRLREVHAGDRLEIVKIVAGG